MASLVEAIDTMVSNGGVRMWNGTHGGGRRHQSILCADDFLGCVTSWAAAAVVISILDEWAAVSASQFGITDDASKTTYAAVTFDGSGMPSEAPAPPWFLAAAFIGGRPIPRLAYDAVYTHVGDRRKLSGDQRPTQSKQVGLCMAWLKHVEQMVRCSPPADEDRAPTFNFILEHDPPKGDPFDRASVIYSSLTLYALAHSSQPIS
ncbi:hypothetical protein Ctob_015918, partial [Chrysochromulina tobinii]